jgi:tRNA U34 2-thiouridine synthase MnmA/TrmU
MDNKKKLEETYIPESASRKEKIVLGLSASLDSLVCAYLLKIQKYDLIAVTVLNNLEELNNNQTTSLSCHLTTQQMSFLSEFCHNLGIPHQVVNLTNEFVDNIIDPWIANKIQGHIANPCWSCHELRIKVLHQKMVETGAKFFATGHYAKLFQLESHHTVFVHSSNDEEHDQSSLLSRLSHEVLSSLLLPLADITKKDVLKLAENFGLDPQIQRMTSFQCLLMTSELVKLIEKRVPRSFLKPGEIVTEDGTIIGQHSGVHLYTPALPLTQDSGDKRVFGAFIFNENKIKMVDPNHFIKNKVLIVNCRFSEEVSFPSSSPGFVLFPDNKWSECWIHPKNLSSVMLEFAEPRKIVPHEMLTVFKKKGKNAKVYLTGEIHISSLDASKDGEQNVSKVDPLLDF